MTPARSVDITRLLKAWGGGDESALHRLAPVIYEELHRMARRCMRRENPGGSIQATALVHEAWLRLVDVTGVEWTDRTHFFAISATMMRRILVDAARSRVTERRGGFQAAHANLDCVPDVSLVRGRELIAIDDALNALAKLDPRKTRVIELRFFGGLSVEETAEVLKISGQSVMRDWKLAKAWLMRELSTPA
jgi:RNA polymerase sigma factor (TIGR02999 family)